MRWPPRSLSLSRVTSKQVAHGHSPHDLRLSFGDTFPVLAARFPSGSIRCRSTLSCWTGSKLPLLGIPKIAPPPSQPVRPLPVPLPKGRLHRLEAATLRARSVLAVSHDLDGLPHTGPAGAPRRSPPATGHGVRHVSGGRRLARVVVASDDNPYLRASTVPSGAQPFGAFPSTAAPVASPRPMPSRRLSNVASRAASGASAVCRLFCRGRADLRALFRCRVRCCLCCASATESARYSLGLSFQSARVRVLAWTCGGRPRLRRLRTLRRGAALPDGRLVIAPVAAMLPKVHGVVERASTGHAGHEQVVFTPVWTLLNSAEALLRLSAGSDLSPRRRCPALSGCAGHKPKLAAPRRLMWPPFLAPEGARSGVLGSARRSRRSALLGPVGSARRSRRSALLCSARRRCPTAPRGCRTSPVARLRPRGG